MAKREVEEISAGSMADIAFLLLIFFLVTTTVEVDAGIGRTLPLKIDQPPNQDPIDIRDRDILEIFANSKDQLLVESELTDIEDLEEIVRDYYTANVDSETNPDMPAYTQVTPQVCQEKMLEASTALAENPENTVAQSELDSWTAKLELCQSLPTQRYSEISKMAIIRLKNQAGTTYGLYIQIQNILKKVVNELRVQYCTEIWDKDYFALDKMNLEDQDIIKKLRILVPERIIEARIDR
jgi:biopolymer transport protein ExbD